MFNVTDVFTLFLHFYFTINKYHPTRISGEKIMAYEYNTTYKIEYQQYVCDDSDK